MMMMISYREVFFINQVLLLSIIFFHKEKQVYMYNIANRWIIWKLMEIFYSHLLIICNINFTTMRTSQSYELKQRMFLLPADVVLRIEAKTSA